MTVYAIFGTVLLNVLCVATALVIYVDPENGTENHKSWTSRTKDYKLAKERALYLNLRARKMSYLNLTCQQNLLDSFQKVVCVRHSVASKTVKCNDNVSFVRECNCVTYDDDACSVLLGECPYGCGFKPKDNIWSDKIYHRLPDNISEYNHEMCGRLNHDGPLCSSCRKGFSPLVYSYDLKCVPCKHSRYNWLKFVAVAFFPLTLFYFVVLLFRIDATSPYLYGFITLNQALASPISLRGLFLALKKNYLLAARIITLPYAVWNLDFFGSLPLNVCLDLTTLQTLALDYAIAIYPLFLVLITYVVIELHARGCRVLVWLWRPFHRCCVRFSRAMDIQSSIIKAFATFLLLSYVKLLNTILDILLPIQLYHINPNIHGYTYG